MDLIIPSHQFPCRGGQVGTVIVVHLSFLYFIGRATEEKEGICLFRNIENQRLIFAWPPERRMEWPSQAR